jgi:hypothetical protein
MAELSYIPRKAFDQQHKWRRFGLCGLVAAAVLLGVVLLPFRTYCRLRIVLSNTPSARMKVLDEWVEKMTKEKRPKDALYLFSGIEVKVCGNTSYLRLPLTEPMYICVTEGNAVVTSIDPNTTYGAIGLSGGWPDLPDGPFTTQKP